MIFTNPRATMRLNNNQLNAIQQQQQQQRLQQINMKPLILFSNQRNFAPAMRPVHKPSNVSVVHAKTFEEQVSAIQNGKKIRWGEPFWNFFHILAEKVREGEFQTIRKGLLDMIFIICSNLPCPDCKTHALQIMKSTNLNHISSSKENLINFLWEFHNHVNKKNKGEFYPKEKLEVYKTANTKKVIVSFITIMSATSNNEKTMLHGFHRTLYITKFKSYINENIHKYNL